MALQLHQFPCLDDNYGFLIHDPSSGATATVDTPEVGPIEAALEEKGWQLTHILNTHHHFDHAGGTRSAWRPGRSCWGRSRRRCSRVRPAPRCVRLALDLRFRCRRSRRRALPALPSAAVPALPLSVVPLPLLFSSRLFSFLFVFFNVFPIYSFGGTRKMVTRMQKRAE
mgnify:CR=1 FL=1